MSILLKSWIAPLTNRDAYDLYVVAYDLDNSKAMRFSDVGKPTQYLPNYEIGPTRTITGWELANGKSLDDFRAEYEARAEKFFIDEGHEFTWLRENGSARAE